jgi:hypothetical protein
LAEARNRIGETVGRSRPAETAPREVARALFHEHLDLAAIRKALGQPSPANLPRPRAPVVPRAAAVEAAPLPTQAQALEERVLALRAAREEEIAAWEQPDADLRPPPQRTVARVEAPPLVRPRARQGLWLGGALLAGVLSAGVWLGFGPDGEGGEPLDRVAEAAPEAGSSGAAAPAATGQASVEPRAEAPVVAGAPGRPTLGAARIEAGQPGLAEVQPAFLPAVVGGPAASVSLADISVPTTPQPPVAVAPPVEVAALPLLAPLPPVVAQPPAGLSPLEAATPAPAFAVIALVAQVPDVLQPPVVVPVVRLPDVAPETAVRSSDTPAPRPDGRVAVAQPASVDRPRVASPAGSSRVVVHHAGGGPQAALTAALRRAGFARVEWRAVPRTTSRTQIRFFHAGDVGLSNRAAAALGQTGRAARQEDFTHFQPPTTPGTVEIWLGD